MFGIGFAVLNEKSQRDHDQRMRAMMANADSDENKIRSMERGIELLEQRINWAVPSKDVGPKLQDELAQRKAELEAFKKSVGRPASGPSHQ